jgi:hypothetical protein
VAPVSGPRRGDEADITLAYNRDLQSSVSPPGRNYVRRTRGSTDGLSDRRNESAGLVEEEMNKDESDMPDSPARSVVPLYCVGPGHSIT